MNYFGVIKLFDSNVEQTLISLEIFFFWSLAKFRFPYTLEYKLYYGIPLLIE